MKKITFQITSVALVVIGLIGCSETNNGKKGLWTAPQLEAALADCGDTVRQTPSAPKVDPICQCWIDAVTFDYTFQETEQDQNQDALVKKLDVCGEKNGEPELLIHATFVRSAMREVNQDNPNSSKGIRKALDRVRAKHAPVAPIAPAAPEAPVDALKPENVPPAPPVAVPLEAGRPAPMGLDSHTQVEGINGEFGGVCVDDKARNSSSRTTYAISFDKEKNEGVLVRKYQQYEGIGCDEAKKNGYGDRLLTQKIVKLEGSKTLKVVGPEGQEAGSVEGFRFETLRTDENVDPRDRRYGSAVLRLVQIDGKPHLLTVGLFSNKKNADQGGLNVDGPADALKPANVGPDVFDDMHFSQVGLSSISALPRIEKEPVAAK